MANSKKFSSYGIQEGNLKL
ncbi:hypothetical protein CCACVL1_01649 [Corchorus capsularis]|uniref:Uncharacterized protein n=1 Tax=Corchorus capsularis TaxID=210143 RepID=A0A1R3KGW7_COCAP|nr:hypothetical protein CCACVL1_01649 [Corchorus capsularis]